MLEEITQLLARTGATGSFATRRSAPPGDLKLEVRGVGRIRFPISTSTARALCAVARPARHGFKDETRLDARIRDTWEIPKSRISIDFLTWKKTLVPQLDRIRRDLGLPEGRRLRAELHNLLVYAPGQFFVMHQDSEKADGMLGTLVVCLPSRFEGGAMAIEHHGEKIVVGGSDRRLTFIAFYADCHHEVRPVKRGYRVVLTYNLIVEGDASAESTPAGRAAALTRLVRDFFETPRAPRWDGDRDRAPPDRLVYLLDHQYTQRGLGWNRFKNADAWRTAALREVARRLDCEIFLALADVHESWECEEEYSDHGRRWRWRYDDPEGEDEEPENEAEPVLTDLIESAVELRHWIGQGGRPIAMASSVAGHELCYTKPSVEFEPFASEHEGYMGNYGNTVDRWYHRAAVILWPRERTFVIRARMSPRWATGEIAKTLKTGDVAAAAALARRLLPFWAEAAAREEKPGPLEGTLQVAAQLDDPELAAALLEPFTLSGVTSKFAPLLADLLERYGLEWCRTLLRRWTSKKNYETPETRLAWMDSALPALCRPLCARVPSDGPALAGWVLAEQWAWVLEHMNQLCKVTPARELAKALSRLCNPILAFIESSRIAKQPELHRQVVDLLTAGMADHPVDVRLGLLRAAHRRYRSDALRRLGLNPIHEQCTRELTARLEAPARARDDWSIATPVRCSCKLCATLNRYLRAPDQVRFEWPLAREQRAHVHGIIDSRDLPVRHVTRRTGRPFTLVLEKTADVFERDAAERRLWQGALEWLAKTAGNF